MQITNPVARAPRPARWGRRGVALGAGLALAALGVALGAGDDPTPGPAADGAAAPVIAAAAPATTTPGPRAVPPPAPAPTPAPAPLPPPEPEHVLPDGRHPAFLTDIDAAGSTLQFDLVQYLDSEAAEQAYEAAHPREAGLCGCDEGPIRNDSHRLRRIPVAPGLAVTLQGRGAALCGYPRTVAYAALADDLRGRSPAPDRLGINGFWLTVRHGEVVGLDEMGCEEGEY
jgi:hypothetical protein